MNEEEGNHGKLINKEILHQIICFAVKHRTVMQAYLDKTGVYQAQHHLLMRISHNHYASQKDLAESMELSTATVAVSLKKLERGGYIKRSVDTADNRLNRITITEKGKKVVEQSRQIFESTDRKIFQGLTEEEKRLLFDLVQKMNANLGKMEEEIHSAK